MKYTNRIERIINLSHLKIAVIEYGDPKGIPVIGMHGWLDNAATFEYIAPFLEGIRLISMDFVGHGLSDKRSLESHYHLIDYVTDLFELSEVLGFEKFNILGHSLGAAIGSLAAGLMPNKVAKLLLIDGLGPFTTPYSDISAHYEVAYQKYKQLPRKKLPCYASIEEALMARAHSGDISVQCAKPIVERGLEHTDAGFTWRTDKRLTNPSFLQMSNEQVYAIFNKITCKTKLIIAKDGIIKHVTKAKERMAQIPHLETEELPGGHHIHLEEPLLVAKSVNSFFTS